MSALGSLKEYAKKLYHDRIRTAGKIVAPVALAGVLFTSCGPSAPPTPTPTPTPNPVMTNLVCYSERSEGRPRKISLNYQNPVECFKGDKLVLRFGMPQQVIIGDTLVIPVFISREVYNGSSISVNYSKQGFRQEPGTYGESFNIEMRTLATIPVDKEVTLKFKLGEGTGGYDFFLPGINFLEPENRWPTQNASRPWVSENRGVIGRVCVGVPFDISIKSDVQQTNPYTSVLISSYGNDIRNVTIKNKDGSYNRVFSPEKPSGQYLVSWLPEKPGVYNVTAEGYNDCFKSVSEPLTILVKE